ncbi:putative tyrosine kinase-like protein [Flavobacterium limicola]|uniref:Putative tyrosine kinase-like protein n=1 Tax=Flavobacterium limicola TaxID=180441 RepID=A0A495S5V8_9FLAO|nr:GNVR domain-containing protein [Flavobacterium limicola]RKS94556.1 putative tyrosine kinase-like protein [Flavobacterium limicola]
MNENIRLFKPFLRGLPIIIAVMIISVLAAKKYLNYVTPLYESTSMLKLADVQEGLPSANLFKDLDVFATANKIATEIEVLKSSNLIQKTLDEIPFNKEIYRKGNMLTVELFGNSPILIAGAFQSDKALDKRYSVNVISNKDFQFFYPNSNQSISGKFGIPLKIDGAILLITLNIPFIKSKKEIKIIDSYEFEFLSNQKLMEKINKNLDIVPVDKDVPVIRINMKSNVPEKAALFVNKLAEVYIRDYIENKYKAANTTVDFLQKEINSSNKKLTNSENNIQNYRDKKNIINLPQETETDLRKISQLKIEQTNIKMSLNAIKDLNKYIDAGKTNYLELAPNFEAFTDLLSTEMVKNIKKLQSDKKDLLLTYTPENEKVKIIDTKLKDIIDYQIESIKNTEKNLQIKYNNLTSDITESEKVFIGLPEKEKRLTILNRDFNLYETNYNFLNGKRIDAEIARSAKIAFHKIITPAEISKTPVSPIRGIIIVVAAIMGLFVSTVLIYIIHFAKAKVNDIYTIEKNSTIPVAIATPFLKGQSAIDDNFLKEAIQIELKGLINKKNIIAISSYDNEKDHLFHSRNLALAFKKQGRKIVIIDATGQLENEFEPTEYLDFSDPKYLSYTKATFQNELEEMMQECELCIIHNQSIKKDKLALLFMSLATTNLIVLDSRKSAEKNILKIELLKDEYKLPDVWFVLNKSGYNPSVLGEVKKIWLKYIKK